jgi:hypothetical protein
VWPYHRSTEVRQSHRCESCARRDERQGDNPATKRTRGLA